MGSTTSDADGSSRTLAEHWTGRKWQVVATAEPDAVSSSYLQAVTAISDTDVWAVGYYYGGVDGDGGTIIEHWDGKSWSLAASADGANPFHASLQGVSALSTTDVWASGFFYDESGAAVTLVEHWNGVKWKLVDSPNSPASPDTELHAVSAVSAKDVWATGFTTLNGSTYPAADRALERQEVVDRGLRSAQRQLEHLSVRRGWACSEGCLGHRLLPQGRRLPDRSPSTGPARSGRSSPHRTPLVPSRTTCSG